MKFSEHTNERTHQPTNQQTRRIIILPRGGKNKAAVCRTGDETSGID